MIKPVFKARARVLKQLGEQLIKTESIALLELIKNSYDADASFCEIIMQSPESTVDGIIAITDDGEGMQYETLAKTWLEIGTSHKEDLRKEGKSRTKKFNRMRLGEKGIGRLGVHRLGMNIEVISRSEGAKECVLKIDWNKIENCTYVENIPVELFERKPETFVGKTGTKIVIKGLKPGWTRGLARECARAIISLNSPFESDESFRATFTIKNKDWLNEILKFEDIVQHKLFDFNILIEGNKIIEFEYNFTPWATLKKIQPRHVSINHKSIKSLTRMVYPFENGKKEIDLSRDAFKIGRVRFKGVIFDQDAKILSLGVSLSDKRGFKSYLKNNGGIRVFRDNMRVLNYGELGDDWLDLGGRRVNMPAKRISNNIILGAVYLDRENSTSLIEKANREGFIENEAYSELVQAIRFALDRIESLRKTDKDLLRKFYGPNQTKIPVITSIGELKDVVEEQVKEESIRKEINRYLDRIEADYDSITNSLIKSAGAGLNLIIVIHQIEKIIKEIKIMLKSKAAQDKLEERIGTLSSLVEGYSVLIKNSEKKVRNLKGILEDCLFGLEFRLDDHGIHLEAAFRKRTTNIEGLCSEGHVFNAILNIIDNSIWWLDYAQTEKPSIFVDISGEYPGHTSIVIADNGPGFTKSTDEIIEPFVSDKPGGMGIGLHLTHQIMESLNGELLFPEMDIFEIPRRYKNGAIIALAFKREK